MRVNEAEVNAKFTALHGLKRCSMGRCCNATEVNKLVQALKMYASIDLKDHPDLGKRADRVLKEFNTQK